MTDYEHKRTRYEETGGHGQDPHNPNPSAVCHVRGLPEYVEEQDLVDSVSHFGQVCNVLFLSRNKQALVEFSDVESAKACVSYSQNNSIYIKGAPVYFNFSTSRTINKDMDTSQQRHYEPQSHQHKEAGGPGGKTYSKILLFTILNPRYPITTEVIYSITTPISSPIKCVIFTKNGVQALIEFESSVAATAVKTKLNGADIYSGCCTLKIEYAKQDTLNVHKNDTNCSWDWSNSGLQVSSHDGGADQEHRYGKEPDAYPPRRDFLQQQDYYARSDRKRTNPFDAHSDRYPPPTGRSPHGDPRREVDPYDNVYAPRISASKVAPTVQRDCVIMAYGLSPKFNCERVFGLFCQYGNVVKVKFMRSKDADGGAMIQMADVAACQRAIDHVQNIKCFGSQIKLHMSRQPHIEDMQWPGELPDRTPRFIDFSHAYDRLQRWKSPYASQRNKCITAHHTLHFFNAPPTITSEQLVEFFEEQNAPKPTQVKIFDLREKDRCSTGLLRFENEEAATEALVLAQHLPMKNPEAPHKPPFTFKLCFTGTPMDIEFKGSRGRPAPDDEEQFTTQEEA